MFTLPSVSNMPHSARAASRVVAVTCLAAQAVPLTIAEPVAPNPATPVWTMADPHAELVASKPQSYTAPMAVLPIESVVSPVPTTARAAPPVTTVAAATPTTAAAIPTPTPTARHSSPVRFHHCGRTGRTRQRSTPDRSHGASQDGEHHNEMLNASARHEAPSHTAEPREHVGVAGIPPVWTLTTSTPARWPNARRSPVQRNSRPNLTPTAS